MFKIIIKVLLILFVFFSDFARVQAEEIKVIMLDPDNILSKDRILLAVNNSSIDAIVIRHDDTLFITSDFFLIYFSEYTEKIGTSIKCAGILRDNSGKEIVCLPLLQVLTILGVRYTYSPLYGKEIIRIRTDNEFRVYSSFDYKSVVSKQNPYGNTPYTKPNEINEEGFSANGYPRINASGPGGCGG